MPHRHITIARYLREHSDVSIPRAPGNKDFQESGDYHAREIPTGFIPINRSISHNFYGGTRNSSGFRGDTRHNELIMNVCLPLPILEFTPRESSSRPLRNPRDSEMEHEKIHVPTVRASKEPAMLLLPLERAEKGFSPERNHSPRRDMNRLSEAERSERWLSRSYSPPRL